MSDNGADEGERARLASASSTLGERVRFLGEMIRSPRRVGSIVPTGRPTARLMAGFVDPASALPVLELGPGTGPITRQILARGIAADKLYLVEYAPDLCGHLRQAFPGVHVINGDAFDLDGTFKGDAPALFDCVVSGVPMLNFGHAERNLLLNDALSRVPPGRPMIQITYGARPPVVPDDPTIAFTASPWVMRNVPPAKVWTYWRGEAETAAKAAAA